MDWQGNVRFGTKLLWRNCVVRLIFIFLAFIPHHIEELQAVLPLACAHDPQPVTQLLLLQELLCEVLKVPAGELLVADHLDAPVAQVCDRDGVAEVASAAFDLDTLLKEGSECRWIEDAICRGLGGVDDVL